VAVGVEKYIAGYNIGAKYYLTRFHARLVPFVGWNVGMGWADAHQYYANGNLHGLGQDFNFNFEVIGGLQYSLTDRSFLRLTAVYSHYSNAGLSMPEHSNKAIDALGPLLGIGWRL
jgi:opacity protein-like surface antigen